VSDQPVPEYAVVVPPPGKLASTARLLLEIAESPYEIRTITGGTSFEVPVKVAEEYSKRMSPTPRRRGRAPRNETEE
jgi:hypothetical protein